MNKNVNVALVMSSDGKVDVGASRQAFETAMSSFIAETETQEATIADAVKSVFDSHKGKALTLGALTTYALHTLNVQPENHTALSTRIANYVRKHSAGDDSLFVVKRGKGGTMRRADMPTESK